MFFPLNINYQYCRPSYTVHSKYISLYVYMQFTKRIQVKEATAEFGNLQKWPERNANRYRVCIDKITNWTQLQESRCYCGVQASRQLGLREGVDQAPMFRKLGNHEKLVTKNKQILKKRERKNSDYVIVIITISDRHTRLHYVEK